MRPSSTSFYTSVCGHSEDLLADESVQQRRDKIKDEYGKNHATDKAKVLTVDWSYAEEECYEHPKVALKWTPEGGSRRGRPKKTWRRTVERERGDFGFKAWLDPETCAKNREAWRERTQGPFSLVGKRT